MGSYSGMVESGVDPDLIALEPLQSPILTTGKSGAHKVEGIGAGFEPPFLNRGLISDIKCIDQVDAFKMCRRLAKEEGLFWGGSTGMNVFGALEVAKDLKYGSKVVTLACDNGLKYLNSNIYQTN